MKDYTEIKKNLLQDDDIKKEYELLKPEYLLVQEIIRKRLNTGMTQKQLAEKIGTKQSAIARLESGASNPSISFLNKVADGLNAHLVISIR